MGICMGGPGGDVIAGTADERNTIRGGDGDDILTGGDLADRIEGGDGGDILSGGGGNDRLFGGRGNDLILIGADGDADRVVTGAGRDVIQGAGDSLLHDVLIGGANVDWIDNAGGRALVLGDAMLGWTGIERLFGAGHAIEGRALAPGGGVSLDFTGWKLVSVAAIVGTPGADRLTGSDSDDTVRGASGDDVLKGGLRHDLVQGGAGADRLLGQGGRDTLDGGAGADVLRGGGGADLFRFGADAAGAEDRIRGFVSGSDRIDLSALAPQDGVGLDWLGNGGFAGDPAVRLEPLSAGAWQLQADLDGDAVADLTIRVDGTAPRLADLIL